MFHSILSKDLKESAFKLISSDWGLINVTDGIKENSMTISWGGMGHLWNKDVLFLFVRPQRYTYSFLPDKATVTVTFLEDGHKKALGYLGSASGRDEDKIKNSKLTPIRDSRGLYFEESKFVFSGKILYQKAFDKTGFIEVSLIDTHYSNEDYSDFIVYEIDDIIIKKED